MKGHWSLPEPLATADVRTGDGTIIVLRRHGNPDGQRLVLSHGSGLATDVYYPFWSLLTERFDLVLYDFRNHGWSARSDILSHNIATFVADDRHVFPAIDRHFGAKPKVGVFHSLSATTALHHDPPGEGFAALVLFDPAIYRPGSDFAEIDKQWEKLAASTRKRQERFKTREELAMIIQRAAVYERLQPGVPDLVAHATLRPAAGEEGYELHCPSAYEAQIYEYAFGYTMEPEPSAISCPVKVIGSDPTAPFSFLPRRDLSGLTGLEYDFVPNTTHFLQLEDPGACVALMLAFLERHGLA